MTLLISAITKSSTFVIAVFSSYKMQTSLMRLLNKLNILMSNFSLSDALVSFMLWKPLKSFLKSALKSIVLIKNKILPLVMSTFRPDLKFQPSIPPYKYRSCGGIFFIPQSLLSSIRLLSLPLSVFYFSWRLTHKFGAAFFTWRFCNFLHIILIYNL